MKLGIYSAVTLLLGTILIIAASVFAGYWQGLMLNLGTGFLGLSVALLIVNYLLAKEEKKKAAVPLLRMVAPAISEFHNDHFIAPGHLAFGMPGFQDLFDAYESNHRRPEALSPPQRDGLYELIKQHREHALPVLNTVHDQLKEMTSLLGWSFSPKIVTASLDARLNIVKFRNLMLDDKDATKLRACELYLDIDAACGGVLRELTDLLGKKLDGTDSKSKKKKR
jgi:hypothetical protein